MIRVEIGKLIKLVKCMSLMPENTIRKSYKITSTMTIGLTTFNNIIIITNQHTHINIIVDTKVLSILIHPNNTLAITRLMKNSPAILAKKFNSMSLCTSIQWFITICL